MPPPKRPGPCQNLRAKVRIFYQTAKKINEKVADCRYKSSFFLDLQTLSPYIPYYIIGNAEKYPEKVWRFQRKSVILRMVLKQKQIEQK